jgi:hypothetical protein
VAGEVTESSWDETMSSTWSLSWPARMSNCVEIASWAARSCKNAEYSSALMWPSSGKKFVSSVY